MLFCDGSVHFLSNDIEAVEALTCNNPVHEFYPTNNTVYQNLFNRMDGNMTASASFDQPVLFASQKLSKGPGTPSWERKAWIHFAPWKNVSSTLAKCG